MNLAFPLLAAVLILFGSVPAVQADPLPAKPPARLEVTVAPRVQNRPPRPKGTPEDANWWHYGVTIREVTGQAGVTLTGWTKCYVGPRQSACEMVRANFKSLFGTDRVPAGGSIRLKKPAWVWADKSVPQMGVEARYIGVDDNGNPVQAGYTFRLTSN
ncbi:MAG: hypothetical protein ISR51_06170 [Rhodospirillales bacterium]|nr:hypothetical protein [Alphaproteobacteria bacterium]MBL6948245.1 hypothetical protein [Rhodospirillales bacterium]